MSTRVPTIRIAKEFRFECAHALKDYNGPCANVHGHSYQLTIVLSGKPAYLSPDVPDGMVMDFFRLKSIVEQHIIQPLDHKLLLNENDIERSAKKNSPESLVTFPFNPTCELLVVFMQAKLTEHLPSYVTLELLRLRETATSYAEWSRQDNA